MSIKLISEDEALVLLGKFPGGPWNKDDLGRFVVDNQNSCFAYTSIDNTTGHCWTEDFPTIEDAISYLEGKDPEEVRMEDKKMKVEFTVTADLDTGTLTVICPEVFEATNNGWGPEIHSNYSADYQERIGNLIGAAVRARFMTIAQLTKKELAKAEASE